MSAAPEGIALEVPGADVEAPGVLEATFDPGACLGEWDFQVLGLAAQIGALVLELEKSRVQLARVGLLGSNRGRRDDRIRPCWSSRHGRNRRRERRAHARVRPAHAGRVSVRGGQREDVRAVHPAEIEVS